MAESELRKVNTLVDLAESRVYTLQQRADMFRRDVKTVNDETTKLRSELIASLSPTDLDKHLDEI